MLAFVIWDSHLSIKFAFVVIVRGN